MMATDRDRVREALAHVPANDREIWLRMGMAVKSELGEDGFDLWDEWSQRGDSYQARDARAVWRSINPNGKVTGGTLFHEAKRHGFAPSETHPTIAPSAEEIAQRKREAREHEKLEAKRRSDAARKAAALWEAAQPANADHPYLQAKGVQPFGIRVAGGQLLIPVRDGETLHSLQTIDPSGEKLFLAGGRVGGCYFSIGKPNGVLCIAEGYATAASIREATGHAVAVAFNAGNLTPVARALRKRLPGIRIVVCADDDYRDGNPGMTKAAQAARAACGVIAVPDFGDDRPDGAKDFNDLARHRGADAVERAIASAQAPEVSGVQSVTPNATAGDSDGAWPAAMDEAALYGIAGEFVRMVEPNTEADPAAILLQFLVAFGALVGRGPHYRVEATQHHANLYAVLIGATSKARKGTSWDRVREVFERIPDWKPHLSGLSSGEGLKYHVRDAREETKRGKKGGEMVMEVVDEGVTDKRLLVTEPEFASVLRVAQRQGNTLSATLRCGWESGTLSTLTKNDPVTATGAHISIIGHIVADELRAELTATDTANGFANRFLFVAVQRSKLLPFGGDAADEAEIEAFAARLRKLAQQAQSRQRIGMSPAARMVWANVYPELAEGRDGMHGAVTARAEAQAVRLALIYALLDGAEAIDVSHLMAALAVWQYCDDTARHVFGASLGDRAADEIMRRLLQAGDAGLTRTEISEAFKRHLSADRIGAALDLLRRKGSATCEMVKTEGRPTALWTIVK